MSQIVRTVRSFVLVTAAAWLLTGCAVGGGIGFGVPIVPGVSFNIGVGPGGLSAGVSTGYGPVGLGVGVNQNGQVTGNAGVGIGIGTGASLGGGAGVGAGIGIGTGTSTVLYDPRAAKAAGTTVQPGADWSPLGGQR